MDQRPRENHRRRQARAPNVGFNPLEAQHADEALAVLTLKAVAVKVLFTDVRMPGDMDGIALSHHVKTHWPWVGLARDLSSFGAGSGRPS